VSSPVPYRFFSDLPQRASNQLFRNFEALSSFIDGKTGVPILVAASNAPTAERTAAAFKCDGVNDEVEINSAIAAAGSNGGIVQLSTGTFNIASTINPTGSSGVQLLGRGMGNTIIKQADSTNYSGGSSGAFFLASGANTLYQDFTFDYNGANNSTSSSAMFAVANNTDGVFWNRIETKNPNTTYGQFMATFGNVSVFHFWFNNCRIVCRSGFSGSGSPTADLFWIVGCDITTTGGSWLAPGGAVGGNANSMYLVDNNVVIQNGTFATTNGAALGGHLHAANNFISLGVSNASNFAAIFPGISYSITGNYISCSTTSSGAAWGIAASSGGNSGVISGNFIDSATVGIILQGTNTVSRTLISGNVLNNTRQDGISVSLTASSGYVTVSGNEIIDAGQKTTNTYAGIHISGGNHCNVTNNRIRSISTNKVAYGIQIDAGVTDTLVYSNDCANAYATAAVLDNGTSTRTSPDPTPPGGSPSGSAGGDLTGTYPNPTLASVITAGGPTGDATHTAQITYDAKGRLTAVSPVAIGGAGLDTSAVHSGDTAGGDLGGTYPNPTVQHVTTFTMGSANLANTSLPNSGASTVVGSAQTITPAVVRNYTLRATVSAIIANAAASSSAAISIHVEYSTDGGSTWTAGQTLQGQVGTLNGTTVKMATLAEVVASVTSWTTSVQVRAVASTATASGTPSSVVQNATLTWEWIPA